MKIAVSAMGGSMEAAVSEKFGRAPYFIVVDADTMQFTPVFNNAESMPGGAGPEAVRQVGLDYAVRQIRSLLDAGAPGIHLYTLNKADMCLRLAEAVGTL